MNAKTTLDPIRARERVQEITDFAALFDLPLRASVDRMSWWIADPTNPEVALNGEEFSLDEWGPYALGFAHGFVYRERNPDREVEHLRRQNAELRFRIDQVLDWAGSSEEDKDSAAD